MKVSLIISIYNSPEYLNLVLCSVARQKEMPFEVIVSEDGNFTANQGVVNNWRRRWPKNSLLTHLVQRDEGNRKPLAMNKALAASQGDYVVFIDGDCVLRSDFIADHVHFAETDSFLTGRRVELSPKATKYLTVDRLEEGYLERVPWFLVWDAFIGKTHNVGRFFRVPDLLRNPFRRDLVMDIRGCNFSVHKKHLVAINGFANDFSGAYGEDSEVELRLKYLGLKMKSIKGAAIQYHLWHTQQQKDPENQERLRILEKIKEPRTKNGLAEALRIP